MRERRLNNLYHVRLAQATVDELDKTAGRLSVPASHVARVALSLGLATLNSEQAGDVPGVHRLTEEGARMLTSM